MSSRCARCSPSEDYISHFSIHSHQNLTMNDLEFGKCFVSLKQNTSNEKVACKKWLYEDGEDGPVDTVVTKVSSHYINHVSESANSML